WFLVPHVSDAAPGRFDAIGAVGLAIGLVTFLVGVSKATDWGWGDARTLGAMAAGLVVLLFWGRYQVRTREPLIDLRTTARLPVRTTLAAAVMATVLTSSTQVFGGLPFPTESAFRWCFALGALAAFAGVAIAAFVPRRAQAFTDQGAAVAAANA